MIQLRNLKSYMVFLIVCGLFLITAITCAITYMQYVRELKTGNNGDQNVSLEITLPVIEWGKYESLSKHYLNSNIKDSK